MIISVNGSLKNEQEAVVSVYDHGFLYGIGVFETFRTYGGRPFLLKEHLVRLEQGCRQLDIAFTPNADRLDGEIGELLEANSLTDAYVRFTVTAGADILGLPSQSYTKPTVIVYVKPLPESDASVYTAGKSLQRLTLPRNTPEGEFRLKSLHYMNNILAKKEMANYPWSKGAEGLMLTADGYLGEGIVSNLFFAKNGKLYTPGLETGILAGITRDYVIKLARTLGVTVKEGLYRWEDLLSADEVFVTNSIQELVPITKLFDEQGTSHIVNEGDPGGLTRKLLTLYREHAIRT